MSNTKFILVLTLCAVSATQSVAQTFEEFAKQQQASYNQFVEDDRAKFNAFRDEINAGFEAMMRGEWTLSTPKPADPIPSRPEPPTPVVKSPDAEPPKQEPVAVDEDVVEPIDIPVAPPKPVVPIPEPEVVVVDKFSFNYYGSVCDIALTPSQKYSLKVINEGAVADGWSTLSKQEYNSMINDCLEWRDKLDLCDWGYFRFVEEMSINYFGKSQINEARLMQLYILTQSGYKVRMARTDNKLIVLIPSMDDIYEYTYLTVSDVKYYIIDSTLSNSEPIYLFDSEFPKEQTFSLRSANKPNLTISSNYITTNNLKLTNSENIPVKINRHLIDFYNDFPRSNNWENYAKRSLSQDVKEQLYPALKSAIKGKSQAEGVNTLLSFVQKSFEYQTDDVQFGEERPLFGDESLFYPYCDCEDRSILFSILVQDIIGIEVVLLNYPGHLATAVLFDSEVSGDYFMLGGKRYVVCDPTYIGASIGESMPSLKKSKAKIIKI